MSRRWRKRSTSAKKLITIDVDGLTVVVRPQTKATRDEAIEHAGVPDIFGQKAFTGAQKAAKELKISVERMVFRLRTEAPEDARAIDAHLAWTTQARRAIAANHVVSIALPESDPEVAPVDLGQRIDWLESFAPEDDEGNVETGGTEEIISAVEEALTRSTLDDEGKGR